MNILKDMTGGPLTPLLDFFSDSHNFAGVRSKSAVTLILSETEVVRHRASQKNFQRPRLTKGIFPISTRSNSLCAEFIQVSGLTLDIIRYSSLNRILCVSGVT